MRLCVRVHRTSIVVRESKMIYYGQVRPRDNERKRLRSFPVSSFCRRLFLMMSNRVFKDQFFLLLLRRRLLSFVSFDTI